MITEFWVNFHFKGHAKNCQRMKGHGDSNRVIHLIRNPGLVDQKMWDKGFWIGVNTSEWR